MLRIKLVKSTIGQKKKNRLIVDSLGLRKMNQVVEHPDNGAIRGMVHHVKHMLEVEVVADAPAAEKPKRAKKATAE